LVPLDYCLFCGDEPDTIWLLQVVDKTVQTLGNILTVKTTPAV